MIRCMSIQRCHRRKSLVMLAWLGLMICIASASSVHHHEDGVHLLHACQLCSLEEITAHGASVEAGATATIDVKAFAKDNVIHSLESLSCDYKSSIRGPPVTI